MESIENKAPFEASSLVHFREKIIDILYKSLKEKLILQGASLECLNKNDLKKLETIKKLYEQQLYMYKNKKNVKNSLILNSQLF